MLLITLSYVFFIEIGFYWLRRIENEQTPAVQAGLTLKWNNDSVEGHINRLKFVKRSMYGRANFDLLRLRILPHRK